MIEMKKEKKYVIMGVNENENHINQTESLPIRTRNAENVFKICSYVTSNCNKRLTGLLKLDTNVLAQNFSPVKRLGSGEVFE
jgi:hypothetical protein